MDALVIPEEPDVMSDEELRAAVAQKPLRVVCGTIGEDEHSVGLREIIDIKHGGIEKYGIEVFYLGTSVPPEKLVNAAIELGADAIVVSNHGGRVLDTAVSALEVLPAIRAATPAHIPLLMDGGVRQGTDVLKAMEQDAGMALRTVFADGGAARNIPAQARKGF